MFNEVYKMKNLIILCLSIIFLASCGHGEAGRDIDRALSVNDKANIQFNVYDGKLTKSTDKAVIEMSITDYDRGEKAEEYIIKYTSKLDVQIPYDYEWLIVDVKVKLLESTFENEREARIADDFKVITKDGNKIENPNVNFKGKLGSYGLKTGQELTNKVALYVPKNESVILEYNTYTSDTIYFQIN